MDIESPGTNWLSQLTAEYGVNSSLEVAQVEAYLIMIMTTTMTIMTMMIITTMIMTMMIVMIIAEAI